MTRTHKLYVAAAFAAVLLPLAGAILAIVQSSEHLVPWADHAVLEIETLTASAGHQLLGTYSRYQWSHPGPPLFYMFVPLYELTGKSPAGLNATAAVINAAAIAGIVLIVKRFAGVLGALFAGAVCALYLVELGPQLLRDFWVPYVVMLPFALYLVACAGLVARTPWLLPLVAFLGCYLALTNLSLAPVTGIVGVAAIAAAALPYLRERAWPDWRPPAIAVAIAAIMCWPPVKEELDRSPGNLATIRKFFAQPDPGHPLSESLDTLANTLSSLVLGWLGQDSALPVRDGAVLVAVLLAALLVAGLVVAVRRERRFAAALCGITLLAIATEAYALTSVRGPMHSYLVQWFSSAAIPGALGIGLALGPELPLRAAARFAAPALAAAVLGLTAYGLADFGRHADIRDDVAYVNRDMPELTRRVERFLEQRNIERPLFDIRDGAWGQAAAVAAQRFRAGKEVAFSPAWVFMFGDHLKPTGKEDAGLTFAAPGGPNPGGAVVAAEYGGVTVWGPKK